MKRIVATALLLWLFLSVYPTGLVMAREQFETRAVHVVEPGDNLLRLAERYRISVGALAVANGLRSPVISVGQRLVIPGADWPATPNAFERPPTEELTYVVQRGDYLGGVARKYGTTVAQIMEASGLASNLIVTNQFLTIPAVWITTIEKNEGHARTDVSTVDVEEKEKGGYDGVSDVTRMRQELQEAGYPYAFSETAQEIYRVYGETVNVLISDPGGSVASEPPDVVREYWGHLSGEGYAQAWLLLTDGFRIRAHDGNFDDYVEGYRAMELCGVQADEVTTASDDGLLAVVRAGVIYEIGSACTPLEVELIITLEAASVGGGWEIEKVAVNPLGMDVMPEDRPYGGDSRWIDVDITLQRVTAMEGDQAVRELVASTGIGRYPTVVGQFWVYVKHQQADMRGVDLGVPWYFPDVPHVMYFFRGYGLHGTYWHNNFGSPMSHGCINLSIPDAEWLYSFSRVGTLVNIHY